MYVARNETFCNFLTVCFRVAFTPKNFQGGVICLCFKRIVANLRSCIEKLLNFHFPESSLETFLSKFFASLILKMHRFKIERKLSSPHPPHWILHASIFILMEKIVALRNPFSVGCRFNARKLMILTILTLFTKKIEYIFNLSTLFENYLHLYFGIFHQFLSYLK